LFWESAEVGIRFTNAPLVQFPFSEHESQLPLPRPMQREHNNCLPTLVGPRTGVRPRQSPTDRRKYNNDCPHEEFGKMEAMVSAASALILARRKGSGSAGQRHSAACTDASAL